ncbi:efflux RND transporter permease subunit [Tepidimonas taiwanensis]|uniref:Cobalt-zinc-cadmium resistance protein CzcA n=1 Tax=Tepidimonas taiwanensis TaxID=307486 RepID=A0A554WZH4_9BURK|nr:efflux RND transporter permease subunit [Tepidimonas taiwanensis]MDM7463580.1 efflux RND transporter permease subunit [Tepidimonas taiwanensis]TSE28983.1 Cobalt-zinc-cadmium resistance protein CzcA [Tepidimonas taiwanensis]UBQ04284.1 efflux RND transporter permease subunit [Tepidimonas taiwanensis]
MSLPNLSALAVRERAVTLFLLILSILGGLYAFLSLGRAEDPAFTVRVMQVNVAWPGASAEQLQQQVVDRLEKRIQEVEYLYRIESTVRPGQATLQVEFHDYTPQAKVPELFYQVRKRMWDEARQMPPGVIGPIANDDFSDVYFSLLALTAPGLPMADLAREADRLRDQLQRIEGVHKAVLIGERTERVYVEFDSARLVNLGLSPQAIFEAIDASNRLVPTGRIETDGPRLHIRLDADLSDPEALAAVPIRAGNKVLRLGDIATIRRGYEEPPSYLVRARGQDAVLIGIVMNKGENGLALGQRLEAYLQAEKTELPLGMALTQLTNQADAIRKAVDLFQLKFLVAVIVVMGVSMLAIGWRAGLIVGIAVPVTLGISFLIMKLMGINLDRITLGALIISLGLLVDDAIISVEMMLVKMEEGWDRVRAAAHAWNVTAAPMLFGTLVTVAGFLPIGFARSGVGEYAGNIFWVLGIALLVSWLVAVVFAPYLGVKMLRDVPVAQRHDHASLYQTPMYQRLRSVITWCVTQRKTVVFGTVALLVLSAVGMATVVQKQFFPNSDRTEVLVSVYLPQGTSVGVTDQTMRRLEAILAPMPEVKTLSTYVGAGAPRFFISANPEPPNPAFGKIIAVAQDEAARDRVMATLEEHIRNGEFAEARVRIARLLYGPPVAWPVQFRVFGPDPNRVREIAYRVRDVMAANPHVVDPHLEWDERVPVLHLRADPERLRLMGLTPQDVAQQLQFLLDGVPVTQLRRDTRSVDLIARGAMGGQRLDAQSLRALELLNRDGRKIPVTQLGTLDVRYEEPVIKRYNREPFVAVQSEVRGAQPNDVTAAVWQALETVRADLPPGYRVAIGGSVEQSGKADASIQKLQPVMVACMLIFIMLQMRSFPGTFMVVATAPLGLIGAVLALLVFQQPFGFVALLGLTGLAGILMRNTLILTQQVSDNFEAGMNAFDGVVEAAVQRARPVVLTALAAVLAFVPLTQDSFWGPLAYVLIGGVAVGTLITLLFVPALYALWFRIRPASQGASS